MVRIKRIEEWIDRADLHFELVQEQRKEELQLIDQTRQAAEDFSDKVSTTLADGMARILRVMLMEVVNNFPDRKAGLRLTNKFIEGIEIIEK